MGGSGQLCSLRLEGTRRSTFSSQLPLTPSLEPPFSCFVRGLGGQGGDGAGVGQAASAAGADPAPLGPAHGLSELCSPLRWPSHFPALHHTFSSSFSISEKSRMRQVWSSPSHY